MSDFGLAAYRGEGNIPHLPEQHFTCYFAGAQVRVCQHCLAPKLVTASFQDSHSQSPGVSYAQPAKLQIRSSSAIVDA